MISVLSIVHDTMVDGPGFRTSIYCAGCPNHCPGCHNPNLLPPEGGDACTAEELANAVAAAQ